MQMPPSVRLWADGSLWSFRAFCPFRYLPHGKFYVLLLGRKGAVRVPFLYLLFLKYLQLKRINMSKWHNLGWHVLIPSKSLSVGHLGGSVAALMAAQFLVS